MPYTNEFKRLRRYFNNQYTDKAKAETFAFQKAFKEGIETFKEKKKAIKKCRGLFNYEINE